MVEKGEKGMTVTTEEAERLALILNRLDMDRNAAALRSLAAERDALRAERDKAQGYLSRCLQALYPNIEPLPDLLGVCTQIDNVLAGQKADNARLREVLGQTVTLFEEILDALNADPAGTKLILRKGGREVKTITATECFENARALLGENE
jgi:hypothetical protein